jgi:AraC-like DNA-binding protein/quercetin dioxygenase-like cupin family protein
MEQQREDARRAVSPSTFGMGRIVLRCHRFTVSTVTLQAGLTLIPHTHRHDQLGVVLAGQYEETSATGAVILRAGSVLWRRAGELHANVIGARPVEVMLVDLKPASSDKLCLSAVDPAVYFAPGLFDEIHHGLVSELRCSDPGSRVAIEALVCLLAARAGRRWARPEAAAPAWLSRAVALIQAGYPHRIRLSRLAAVARVHPVTVAAAFRRHFGQSVGEYVRDLRIAHAREALENTSRTIAAIALEAGFYDESHMGRVFRRRFGVPPGTVRARRQGTRRH